MSIVVGMVSAEGTYLASDTQVTSDDGYKDYEAIKIFAGKEYLMGVAGDYKIVNLMEHFSFKWDKGDKKKFLITQLPLMIKDYLEPYRNDSDKDDSDEYSVLIAYDEGLCEITERHEASLIPLFHAIGTGAPYAFGAYHVTMMDYGNSSEQILKYCVGAAMRYNAFCGGDVVIEKLPD